MFNPDPFAALAARAFETRPSVCPRFRLAARVISCVHEVQKRQEHPCWVLMPIDPPLVWRPTGGTARLKTVDDSRTCIVRPSLPQCKRVDG
jgi:hypothetical protein